jgi:hypothetical protein
LIVRKEIEGFVPQKEVPVSILNYVPETKIAARRKNFKNKQNGQDKPTSHAIPKGRR